MITKLDKYIKEGVRDLMTPKTSDELDNSTKKFSPKKKLEYGINNSIPQLVKSSIEEDVDVNMKDSYDKTPLIWVASKTLMDDNDVTIVKMLLDNGAEVNHQDSFGLTALMFAAYNGDFKMVELLMDNGADASIKNKKDCTAVDFAEMGNHRMVMFLLRNYHLKKTQDEMNEGVKDKMTPRPPADTEKMISELFKEMEGMDIIDKLEVLNSKNILRYLDKKWSMSLVLELLEKNKKKNEEFRVTGPNNEFYIFENKAGNGLFIFNRNNFRIYHVGLFAAKEVIGALNFLL